MTCVGAIPFTEGSGYESIEPNVLKKYGDDAHEQKVVLSPWDQSCERKVCHLNEE